MTLSLTRPIHRPWQDPATWWSDIEAATEQLDPPYAVLALDALAHNAHDLLDRAAPLPIRVASKSVRVRGVLDAVLSLPGYRGVLAYTLPEALWLAGDPQYDDVVVGYPTAHRAALASLAADEALAARVTLMVDDPAQLDLVDSVAAPGSRAEIRVALELDASLRAPVLGHLGVRRSPLHAPGDLLALAREVTERRGFRLVGLMAYEAQIAGVGNAGSRPVRAMQRASAAELRRRRGRAVRKLRELVDLEFVNGGGTGSLESTAADASVTELAAGSGLFGPHLFDHYAHFSPAPATCFALSVVRRPTDDIATVLGGGWIASGPPADDRLPLPVHPPGLSYLPREAAGEVQSPLAGAGDLPIGARVWFRHTKAGELAEHVDEIHVVADGRVVDLLPTYRGEGKAFL